MQKGNTRLVVFGALSGLLMFSFVGCSQKTVKLDPVQETAVVADTASAQQGRDSKTEKSVASKATDPSLNEGAGPGESLDTPLSGQGSPESISGSGYNMSEVVAGSRTALGFLPVFFDYDKSLIRQDQVERIAANAQFLKDHPAIKVRIEGNCDSRGTNEYNLALGERRAMGAMKYLVNLGIAEGRVSILSYGEERPVNPGNDEIAWAENRRGDFVVVE